MTDEQTTARIEIFATPTALDTHHALLVLTTSDGTQAVVRGGPSAQPDIGI